MNSSGTPELRRKDSGRPPDSKKVLMPIEFPKESPSVARPCTDRNETSMNELHLSVAVVKSLSSRSHRRKTVSSMSEPRKLDLVKSAKMKLTSVSMACSKVQASQSVCRKLTSSR